MVPGDGARLWWKLFLRLLAPFLPFITEEIWSWSFKSKLSIHQEKWPQIIEFQSNNVSAPEQQLDTAIQVLTEIRSSKSQAQKNMKHPVQRLEIHANKLDYEYIKDSKSDLLNKF